MSLVDGIVNAAKSVLGIESSDNARKERAHERRDPGPARGNDMAIDTATAFDRPERSTATTASTIDLSALARQYQAMHASSTAVPGSDAGIGAAALDASTPQATREPATPRAMVQDAGSGTRLGTVDTLAPDTDAGVAAANVQRGLDYFAQAFGRNGIDGAGSGVDVLINDRSKDENGNERFAGNGGYYATEFDDGTSSEAIHFGTGDRYRADRGLVDQAEMFNADDLTIHELTHGVIRKETGHLGGDADESGATNEGIADVLAAAATRDWRIGESMYRPDSDYKLMRNIADPSDPTAVHGLWTSMSDVQAARQKGQDVEEHWASGVISTAAFRVQQRLGGGEDGWRAVEQVFYDTIASDRLGTMSFQDTAAALRTSAATLYGAGSPVTQVFDEELRRGGL